MNTLEQTAERAAAIVCEAGEIALSYFRQDGLETNTKDDSSPVTQADMETEEFIRAKLAATFPEHGILGEEFGISGDLDDQCWIVDPIDGTRFFVTGYPTFGTLLALLEKGIPRLGIVRMPALNETFVGLDQVAATHNGKPIKASGVTKLDQAKLFINEAERTSSHYPALFERLCNSGHTRRMSYDCYPHAMVAAGHIDAVTDMGLEPYDYLPLVPIVQAAGGVITDWKGQPLNIHSDGRVLTAATPELHEELLAMLDV